MAADDDRIRMDRGEPCRSVSTREDAEDANHERSLLIIAFDPLRDAATPRRGDKPQRKR